MIQLFKKKDSEFSDIVGYDDIKELLTKLIHEEENQQMNVLLLGSPATSKTLFLKSIRKQFNELDCVYFDFSNTTGRGFLKAIIEARELQKEKQKGLFKNKNQPLILLLDEIDKIKPRSDLNMLLNLLEGQEVHYTTANFEYHISIPIRVFATTNSTKVLPKPFISRFMVLQLGDYSQEDFIKISVGISKEHLRVKNDQAREEIAEEIATKLYKKNIKDIRQIINIMKLYNLYKNKPVDQIIEFQNKYTNEETE